MFWVVLVMVAVGVLMIGVVAAGNRHARIPPQDPDPLFIAGIAIAGASAALIATLGLMSLPMTIIGIVFIAVGARRSRARQGADGNDLFDDRIDRTPTDPGT